MPEFTEAELGRDQGPAVPQKSGAMPKNATFAVPHIATSATRVNTGARAFSVRYDEALTYNRVNAGRMLLDPVIKPCLSIRAETVAGITWNIKPEDPENKLEVDAAAECEKYLRRIPHLQDGLHWLALNGIWCGRSALRVRWGWSPDEVPIYTPNMLQPIHGDKLAFKWDGKVGIAIQSGALGYHKQTALLDGFPVYFLNDDEREGVIVHRRWAEDVDYWNPLQQGQINGVGLRHVLYWLWVLKYEIWKMGVDYLQWFAKGFTCFFFEYGNDEHRAAVQSYIEQGIGSDMMLLPVMRGGGSEPYMQKPFEHIDVSTASPQFILNLLQNYFDDLIRFVILHQSATTSDVASGMGSGVAEAHEGTFNSTCVKPDATSLAETLSSDLVAVWYRANKKGIAPGKWMFQVDMPNAQSMIDGAQAIVAIGGSVAQEPLMEACGIPAPTKGDTILGGPAPSQPTAVGAVPDGTPMVSGDDSGQQPVQ